jgi:hypothetical protein
VSPILLPITELAPRAHIPTKFTRSRLVISANYATLANPELRRRRRKGRLSNECWLPQTGRCQGSVNTCHQRDWSTKVDRLFDDVIERRVLGRQYHTQFQFSALALAFTYNTLNLPLRGNADRVKELALGDVEPILVSIRCPSWKWYLISSRHFTQQCLDAIRGGLLVLKLLFHW